MKNVRLITVMAFLLTAGIAFGADFGTLTGTFNNVPSYSNGSVGYNSGQYNSDAGINTGLKWQCVEYVNRYYYLHYNMSIRIAGQDANQYYPNASSRHLSRFQNGSSTPPQVGDVLCFEGHSGGHVAIVRDVNSTQVTVIQQNVKENSLDEFYRFPLSVSGGAYTVDGSRLGTSYYCQGWLRKVYSGGSGTAGDPYKIATKQDLLDLAADANDYGKCFILTADIDIGGQVFTAAIIAALTDYDYEGTAFTGTFDGNGHKVVNFTINGDSDNSILGLFGYISNSASVKNLGLENYTVSGSSGSELAGGLTGINDGSISNCYSTGQVSVSHCGGGLVGWNNYGSISNCYSTGQVSVSDCGGGLVGWNSWGSISNCYSTGTVSGRSNSDYAGGLVGGNYVIVSGSFWDTQTSGQTIGVGYGDSNGVTGMMSAQMKTLSTFTSPPASWDFTNETTNGTNDYWKMLRPGQDYPRLAWQPVITSDIAGLYGVNAVDSAVIAAAWPSTPSSPKWNPSADLNSDGVVNFLDIFILSTNWLEGI